MIQVDSMWIFQCLQDSGWFYVNLAFSPRFRLILHESFRLSKIQVDSPWLTFRVPSHSFPVFQSQRKFWSTSQFSHIQILQFPHYVTMPGNPKKPLYLLRIFSCVKFIFSSCFPYVRKVWRKCSFPQHSLTQFYGNFPIIFSFVKLTENSLFPLTFLSWAYPDETWNFLNDFLIVLWTLFLIVTSTFCHVWKLS